MSCQHEDCPICMEVFTGVLNVVVTECGHKFHTNCLMTSVAHNGFGCPYCRAKMAEEIEDSDDEDEDDMSIDSEDQEALDREENRALGGVRWLFNRANDEELSSVYDGEDEDSDSEDEDEEEDQEPKPSAAFIAKKLTEQGVTVEHMVKSMLLSHEEYGNEDEAFSRVDDELFGKIRILITNFQPEQEPKVAPLVKLEEVSAYYSDRFNRVV
jgi:hypothetical protein